MVASVPGIPGFVLISWLELIHNTGSEDSDISLSLYGDLGIWEKRDLSLTRPSDWGQSAFMNI